MAADVCFYDFPYVVTKGHNNNMWRPAAPIVTFIVINEGLCGHLRGSVCVFVRRWWGGRVVEEGGSSTPKLMYFSLAFCKVAAGTGPGSGHRYIINRSRICIQYLNF